MCDHPASSDVALFVHGELDGARRARFEAHVAQCGACAEQLAGEARLELALFEVASAPPARMSARRTPRRHTATRAAAAAVVAIALVVMTRRDAAPPIEASRAIPGVICAAGATRASCIERAYRHGLYVQYPSWASAPPLGGLAPDTARRAGVQRSAVGPSSSPFPGIDHEDL